MRISPPPSSCRVSNRRKDYHLYEMVEMGLQVQVGSQNWFSTMWKKKKIIDQTWEEAKDDYFILLIIWCFDILIYSGIFYQTCLTPREHLQEMYLCCQSTWNSFEEWLYVTVLWFNATALGKTRPLSGWQFEGGNIMSFSKSHYTKWCFSVIVSGMDILTNLLEAAFSSQDTLYGVKVSFCHVYMNPRCFALII